MLSLFPLRGKNSICHLKLQHFSFLIFKKSFDALNSKVIPSPNGAESEVGYTVYNVTLATVTMADDSASLR